MSEFGDTARRGVQMAEAPPLTSDELSALRADLAARALRMGLPRQDVEDVVDRAIEKAASERNPDPEMPFGRRVGAALTDVHAEYYRRRATRPVIEAGASVPDVADNTDPHQSACFAETVEEMRAELGVDVAKFAVMTCTGLSERAIGERLGWDPLRTQRVRRRFARNAPAFLRSRTQLINHKEAS
jgi:DNA-directed RNA polymerase specialized sigma24 family protein